MLCLSALFAVENVSVRLSVLCRNGLNVLEITSRLSAPTLYFSVIDLRYKFQTESPTPNRGFKHGCGIEI